MNQVSYCLLLIKSNSWKGMKSFLCFCIAVPSQPTDFKGEAKSETSIVLSWIAPAQTGQENQITGYELVYRKRDDIEEVFSPVLLETR